jgi:penicillin-binding protein 1A
LRRIIGFLFSLFLLLVLAGAGAAYVVFEHYSKGLPDYTQLADYKPLLVTRVHAGDGRVLAEYATENRVFVPIQAIPPAGLERLHLGRGQELLHPSRHRRARHGCGPPLTNLAHIGTDRRPVGASTITQQVAKNFLLTNEVSLARKVKELLLAYRIEHAFTKDRILELYLNEIYLGGGSYGVAAAALNYFNKSLDELTVAEAAMLAAMPKAPNNYNPLRHPEAAKARRDWVIGRMLEDGHITQEEAKAALAEPLLLRSRGEADTVTADYFAEEVRRELVAALRRGRALQGRPRRCGPRSTRSCRRSPRSPCATGWSPTTAAMAGAGRSTHVELTRRLAGAARRRQGAGRARRPGSSRSCTRGRGRRRRDRARRRQAGPHPAGRAALGAARWPEGQRSAARRGQGLRRAQGRRRRRRRGARQGRAGKAYPAGTFGLRQIPDVSGAIIAMDPHTGRVLAMQRRLQLRA